MLAGFGRQNVLALRTRTRRRVFTATLSVHRLPMQGAGLTAADGTAGSDAGIGPAGATWQAPASGTSGWDWHLRRELVARLLELAHQQEEDADADPSAPVLLVWTRPGPAEHEDGDAAWWSAAHSAGADLATQVSALAVVTRWGWWMLPEGPGRRWQRLRAHRGEESARLPLATGLRVDGQSSGQV